MSTEVSGFVAPGFEGVRDAFRGTFDGYPEMGAALAIRRRGEPVVDLWGGFADARGRVPWASDTASVIFSCTKGLSSILVARLVQEGRLDYEARVTDYWPEYGQAGKGETTVGNLVSHQAGLSAPRVAMTVDDIIDWGQVTALLAAQEPLWTPGTGWAYHAITHGWLAGELVRRATGMTVGGYFRTLVTGPLGLDAWIGLPLAENRRVARMSAGPTLRAEAQQRAMASTEPNWLDLAMTLGGALPPELVGDDAGFNDPRVRNAEIPGAGGIATARSLAAIWSAAVTPTEGIRLLDDATLARALEPATSGRPVFPSPPPWPRWGMGFQLDSPARRYLTEHSFGHDGAGGQLAFGDPHHGVGFAFLTNWMEAANDQRASAVVSALREAL